ncbi:MAG: hypothetical protein U9Q70_00975 [Chloroflexota bacterium]|nr:hypothetical protein [Chloroflexota bacterium]
MSPHHPPKEPYSLNGKTDNDEGLLDWEELRTVVAEQTEVEPPPEIERRVLAQIRVREAERLTPAPTWYIWAQGVLVAILVTALLWGAFKPGLALEWEAETTTEIFFRISRTPQGSNEFVALYSLESAPAATSYRYVDVYVWPGTSYIYRVEALDAAEKVLAERFIIVEAVLALPGQLAVLFSGLMVGYGAVVLWQLKQRRAL